MIWRRTWERYRNVNVYADGWNSVRVRDIYEGYFLFGIIPFYVSRVRYRAE